MDWGTYLGMFTVVALVLSSGVLVISLLASNPLFRTESLRTEAVVGLGIGVLTVAGLLLVGTRRVEWTTSYW